MTIQATTATTARVIATPAFLAACAVQFPDLWDADFSERMIVERAMRPRTWESEEMCAAWAEDEPPAR